MQVWCRAYVPEAISVPTVKRTSLPYDKWVRDGHMVATPGEVIDYDYIEKDLASVLGRFNVQDIAYDPWNAGQLVNNMTRDGAPMIEFRQGIPSFNSPCKELERRVIGRELAHGGNPMLAWMAGNVVIRSDVNENIAPDRKKSPGKIDGMVAVLMALGRMFAEDDEELIDIPEDYDVMVM